MATKSGYTEIDYITVDGTIHMGTGCVPTSGTLRTKWRFEITERVHMNISGNWAVSGSGSYNWLWWNPENGFGTWQYNPTVPEWYPAPTQYKDIDTLYEVEALYSDGHRELTVNGTTYTTDTGTTVGARQVWLFSNSPSEGKDKAHIKLYSLEIYDGDTKIGDFVPMERIRDSVQGLYNRIDGFFYYPGGNETLYAPWIMGDDGYPTNEDFPEVPAEPITKPYPKALWRIDPQVNNGYPYHLLLPGLSGIGVDLWALERENVIRSYDISTPQDGFDNNGLAVLDPVSCIEHHDDDRWDIELTHPLDEWDKWKTLLVENVLKVDGQLFRIDIQRPSLSEEGALMYAHARHISEDMAGDLVADGRGNWTGGSPTGFINYVMHNSHQYDPPDEIYYPRYRFDGYTDYTDSIGPIDLTATSLWGSLVGIDDCLKNVLGGELYRDNFYFSICKRMQFAKDNAFYLRYSLDMTEIEYEVDYTELVTKLIVEDNFGNWSASWYVPETRWAIHHPRTKFVKFTYSDDLGPDENMERLNRDKEALWAQVAVPKVTITARIAALSDDPRYKDFKDLQDYRYGDRGKVYCQELDLETDMQISSVDYDRVTGNIISMTLGSVKSSLIRPTFLGATISSGRTREDKQAAATAAELKNMKLRALRCWDDASAYTWDEISQFTWEEVARYGYNNT